MASAASVLNEFFDAGERTEHPCVRCCSFFASREARYNGRVGCIFVPVNNNNRWIFHKTWDLEDGTTVPQMRCLRCWNSGQDCLAVHKDLRNQLPKINAELSKIERYYEGGRTLVSQDIKLEDESASEVESLPLPQVTREEMELSLNRLTAYCLPLRSAHDKRYIPHGDYLQFHSGVLQLDQCPDYPLRPATRQHSTFAIVAKSEASARRRDREIDKLCADSDDDEAPTKKAKRAGKAL